MNFDLYKHTVYLTLSGSQAYGMATPESDYDYRGIAIAPMNCYIGLLDKFEQFVDNDKGKHVYTHFPVGLLKTDPRVEGNDPNEAPDMQIMEITKFVGLALQNNPSVIETLFTDEADRVICHPIMKKLIDNRDKLLYQGAKARYAGYSISQLKRLKAHKRWLDNPITHKPERKEFGLPEHGLLSSDQMSAALTLIQKELDEFMIDQTHLPEDIKIELYPKMAKMMKAVWAAINDNDYPIGPGEKFESMDDALFWGAAKDQEFSENFLQVLVKEKQYRAAKADWDRYQIWLATRNPKRAELEKKYHYDCKFAFHLVRLLKQAREIITTGKVIVKRPDAEELLAIRNGAWTYEQIVEFAEKEDAELDKLVKESKLPKAPNIKFFDPLVREMILEFNRI